MASPVRNLDLEGVPLRRTLQLALAQLDLGYFIVDGMLYITSLESAESSSLPPSMPTPSPQHGEARKSRARRADAGRNEGAVRDAQDPKGDRGGPYARGEWLRSARGPPRTAASTEEAKQNKELIESLSKLTQSLLEELKELRNTKQPEKRRKKRRLRRRQ